MKKIRVLIADDHAVLRAGLIKLLNAEADIEVAGEAGNGAEAILKTEELSPDVLLLDITMPGMGGIDVVRALKAKNLPVAVLILTMHEDEGYLREALKAGVLGYVPKKAADAELISAIRAVHRGEIYIYPSMAKSLVAEALHGSSAYSEKPADTFEALSKREREVLQLIAQGFTNQEIAGQLFISVKTVETYKARLMEKLSVSTRSELVRCALQHGLLTEM
jgi:two-component system, NarL family, response regulator NreC